VPARHDASAGEELIGNVVLQAVLDLTIGQVVELLEDISSEVDPNPKLAPHPPAAFRGRPLEIWNDQSDQ